MGDYRKSAVWIMGEIEKQAIAQVAAADADKTPTHRYCKADQRDSLANLALHDNRCNFNCAYRHESLGKQTLRCQKSIAITSVIIVRIT
ncbi:hypothetical protein [Caballeronia sp. LZ001]|uniref:hypothetical protein n=1 Tax=Caballeronia sp. LZ001 TaxID=3038553 RepID=UPI002863BB2B|nr:hypothetical protein [Caballeronia sp. LZ001]MDR5800523.1 hypothetical protein [Caballeronia sp. LZ001]